MGRYVVRRLLQFIPTVLGTLFLLHYLTSMAIQFGGNPVRSLFGDRTPPEEQLRQMTEQFGLGDPCLQQKGNPCFGLFWERMQDIFLRFDFGQSLAPRRDVTDVLADALPYTIKLTIIAFIVEAVLGLAAGVLAGLRNGKFSDYVVRIVTVLMISVPIFVSAVLVQKFVGVKFGNWLRQDLDAPEWLGRGLFGAAYKAEFPWLSLILPGIVLGMLTLASTARLTRGSLLENLRADYVRTAKAKGLTTNRVIGVHTLRNSLIPVVTTLGLSIGGYMAGAVVTEGVFRVPGVGFTILKAIATGEPMVLIGLTTVLVLVYLVLNLFVDLLYAVLDPRIRYE
ncbi:ABC transporter permease [Allorhizocola rhizosphaerae]|uniref:ABC transporter permease n=1 Tax=Allorhizocola rhizosphaerae TaxID=1872709 RepID=UPI000E3E846D|nr:ABC transporter permease [Allorhizocola rhizosphaerae]